MPDRSAPGWRADRRRRECGAPELRCSSGCRRHQKVSVQIARTEFQHSEKDQEQSAAVENAVPDRLADSFFLFCTVIVRHNRNQTVCDTVDADGCDVLNLSCRHQKPQLPSTRTIMTIAFIAMLTTEVRICTSVDGKPTFMISRTLTQSGFKRKSKRDFRVPLFINHHSGKTAHELTDDGCKRSSGRLHARKAEPAENERSDRESDWSAMRRTA